MIGSARQLRMGSRLGLLVFAASCAALAVIAFAVLSGDAFNSIDSAVKFIQASAFARSGFRSMALPYPGATIDPAGTFVPFEPPFVFRNAGGYESIFPSAFAMLASLVVPQGVPGLRLIAVLGGASTAAFTARLSEGPGPSWMAGALLLFATPVWFYATATGEASLALAASTLAFVLARSESPSRDLACGLCLGAAAVLRDESLLLLPGLLYARRVFARDTTRYWPCVVGLAIPILAMAVVDHYWLERPVLAHLRHAAPFLNAVLPRSHALLPELPLLSWRGRYDIIVHYWWLGGGTPTVATAIVATIVLAALLRRRRLAAFVVLALLAVAAVVQMRELLLLVREPKFIAGLLRLSPFLLLVVLPLPPSTPPMPQRRVILVASAAFIVLVWLTLSTSAGKGLGPRLTIGLWPLLVAASWDALVEWWRWTGSRALGIAISSCAALLVAGSIVIELCVALPVWAARVRDDDAALDAVRRTQDQILVIDNDIDLQVLGRDFFERRIFYVARPAIWTELAGSLTAGGEREFLLVSRTPSAPPLIGDFHLADQQVVSRYHLQHYIR